MADFNVSKNPDNSYKVTVKRIVTQEANEEFAFGSLDEALNKVREVEVAEAQPQA